MAEHELNKIVDDDGEVFNLRDSTKQPVADRVTAWSSTPSDTKYPSEKLVKDSLDGKQATLTFDGTYNASTNKAATVSTVTNAIGGLDVSSVGGNGKYISAISETDGKISATATTMDTTPTASSTNAVTSGGIYNALADKVSSIKKNDTTITPSSGVANIGYVPTTKQPTTGTVQSVIQELRVSPGGGVGSVQITASTVGTVSIPTTWYNYIWLPHRTGAAADDNQNYGTLIITPMTTNPDVYVIEGSALNGSSPTYRAKRLANTDKVVLYADEQWGGAFRTSLSPFDNYAFKNAYVFFGAKPSALRVEYSTDGGTTWVDYGLTDEQKVTLFSQFGGTPVYCGHNTHIQPGYTGSITGTKDLSNDNIANQRLRITICNRSLANEGTTGTTNTWLYCNLRRIGIYMSTQSASAGVHCVFEKRTSANFKSGTDTWVTVGDYKIQGDSGWNSIPCGNDTASGAITFGSNDSQYSVIRFTIWSDVLSSNPAASQTENLCIMRVVAYSELVWSNVSANPNLGNYSAPYTVNALTGVTHFSKGITSGVAIPISSGGTGATTAKAAQNNLLDTAKTHLTAAVQDTYRLFFGTTEPSATNGIIAGYRTASEVWSYMKGKMSSDIGVNISGNAATATDLAANSVLSVSKGGTGKSSVTSNSFLVGNGTSALVEKTPAQVLSLIGAQGAMTEMTTQEVTDFINDLGDL